MLAKEGMVVAVIEVDQNDLSKITNIELISRGFVFTKEAGDLLNHGAQEVTKAVAGRKDKIDSDRVVKSIAVDTLEKFFFHKTARRPMILPVVVEV
jgi:ribonuclease J